MEIRLTAVQSLLRWLPLTETWLYTQVRYLPPDIESHVVCRGTQNLDAFPHPRIHSFASQPTPAQLWDRGMRRLGFRRHLGLLSSVIRDSGARIVHSHMGNQGWMDSRAVAAAGARHVVTFYGVDVGRLPQTDPRWNDRYADMFGSVGRVLCEGEHMAQRVVDLGCPEARVRVHHLGIELDRIPYEPRTWRPGEPLRVFMAGSFREKKGMPYALRALARIRSEVALEVTVVGDASDEARSQDEKRLILAAIEEGNLGDNVELAGYQPYDTMLAQARSHHVFLSPSVTAADGDTEGGAPVTIIEMAASGMMIVSTTHCDIPGVVKDGESGLLTGERDVDGLVERLVWLIANPGEWRRMQDAGRAHIENEFDASRQGERLGAIYEELVEPDRGSR
jgi:colanic acid/amylovoran biosynthesis glycosyltransferase